MSDRFGAVPQRSLFLSCVSHEFRTYRDVLATNLAQPGVELRRQEDFVNSGSTTLEKLCEYIRTCDAVIHLVGNCTGASPVPAAVEALLVRCPDLISKFELQELMQPPGLSYTQWEAWIALYFGKPLSLFQAAETAQRELGFADDPIQRQRQQLHWDCLKKRGRDRGKEFVSPHDLSIEVLRSLPLLVPGYADNVRRGQFRDRNLLFAVLALSGSILSREDFVKVCMLWAADTDRPIAEVMQREGHLNPDDQQIVEKMLDRKLKAHDGDARASLAENLGSDVRQSLGAALDPSTFASLPDRMAALNHLVATSSPWRYRLTRTHGSGGLGIVSVAADSILDRDVAVKQLRSERMLDPMAIERFVREARITGRLQHPNIVPVYELGISPDDQIPFYAMRFVGHHTLQDVITRHYTDKTASESERNVQFGKLLQSFLLICSAVDFSHKQGVIHRDIKPANVMIGDFGEVILLDWGLAKRVDELEPVKLPELVNVITGEPSDAVKTQGNSRLGSPAYMAPEQAAGRVDLHGTHTDIYGLGATLYEILTGDVPFTGKSTEELMSAIQSRSLRDPCEHNPRIAPELSAICRKAMEKRPEERYLTAKELAEDIQHWMADEPVSVFDEPIMMRMQRVARKNPGPFAALAASLLVGIIGLGGGLYFVNSEKNLTKSALVEKDKALEQEQKALKEAKTQTDLAIFNERIAKENEARAIAGEKKAERQGNENALLAKQERTAREQAEENLQKAASHVAEIYETFNRQDLMAMNVDNPVMHQILTLLIAQSARLIKETHQKQFADNLQILHDQLYVVSLFCAFGKDFSRMDRTSMLEVQGNLATMRTHLQEYLQKYPANGYEHVLELNMDRLNFIEGLLLIREGKRARAMTVMNKTFDSHRSHIDHLLNSSPAEAALATAISRATSMATLAITIIANLNEPGLFPEFALVRKLTEQTLDVMSRIEKVASMDENSVASSEMRLNFCLSRIQVFFFKSTFYISTYEQFPHKERLAESQTAAEAAIDAVNSCPKEMALNPAFLFWKGMAFSCLGEVDFKKKNYADAWKNFRDALDAFSNSMAPKNSISELVMERLPGIGLEYLRSADRSDSIARPKLRRIAAEALELVNQQLMELEAILQKGANDVTALRNRNDLQSQKKKLSKVQVDLRSLQSELNAVIPE